MWITTKKQHKIVRKSFGYIIAITHLYKNSYERLLPLGMGRTKKLVIFDTFKF